MTEEERALLYNMGATNVLPLIGLNSFGASFSRIIRKDEIDMLNDKDDSYVISHVTIMVRGASEVHGLHDRCESVYVAEAKKRYRADALVYDYTKMGYSVKTVKADQDTQH